jgi:hypothetical protein
VLASSSALARAPTRPGSSWPTGKLIKVLLAVNATEHLSESPTLGALALCTFGGALAAAQAGAEASR